MNNATYIYNTFHINLCYHSLVFVHFLEKNNMGEASGGQINVCE